MNFLLDTAVRRGDADILHNKSKFVKASASSGNKKSIEEMLADACLRGQLADVKAADVISILYHM
jgi:hypothetical protein